MSDRMAIERKKQGEKVQLHEAAFFLLVIDDVERVDDRLHSGVGAPKGDRESGYEAEAELCIALCGKPRDLLVKNVDCAGGKNARRQRKMRVNGRSVGDQSVERDERSDGREDRQQRIEDDASRDSEQPVVIHARIDAPEDILPTCPGNLPRSQGVASPALLLCSAQLGGNRLIVLDLLLRPFVGIDLGRRTSFVGSLAVLIRRGINRPVRFADRLVAFDYRAFVSVCLRRAAAIAARPP